MSTVQTAIDYANTKIQGNGNLSSADGLLFANEAKSDYRLELIKRGVEAAQIQESYRDVEVAAANRGSTFLYPTDMLLLKQISVNYTDTTQQNYIIVQQIDVGNTQQNMSFEFLRVNQPVENPLFDDRGDWFEMFPAFTTQMNLVQALRIFYYLAPDPYTSTSDTLLYPESVDPYVLSSKMVALYYERQEKFDQADHFQSVYLKKVDRVVDTLVRGADRPITAQGLGLTGWEF